MSANEDSSGPPRPSNEGSRPEWRTLARRIAAFLRGDINVAESLSEKPQVSVVPWIRDAAADEDKAEFALAAALRSAQDASETTKGIQDKAAAHLGIALTLVPLAIAVTVLVVPLRGPLLGLRVAGFVLFLLADLLLVLSATLAFLAIGLHLAGGSSLERFIGPESELWSTSSDATTDQLKVAEADAWHYASRLSTWSGQRKAADLFAARRLMVIALLVALVGTPLIVAARPPSSRASVGPPRSSCPRATPTFSEAPSPVSPIATSATVDPTPPCLNPAGPPPRPDIIYVALGDSYSSGEGVQPFFETSKKCHRSELAYSQLLGWARGNIQFWACSGAVVDDFYGANRKTGEPAQIVRLMTDSQSVGLVTISIGGNDLGFARIIIRCVLLRLRPGGCRNWAGKFITRRYAKLGDRLEVLYSEVARLVPNARVLVVGYPNFFPQVTSHSCEFIKARDVVFLHSRIERFDEFIRAEVLRAAEPRVEFVDPRLEFVGHDICEPQSTSWFVQISLEGLLKHRAYLFHPTAEGQQGIADLVTTYDHAGG